MSTEFLRQAAHLFALLLALWVPASWATEPLFDRIDMNGHSGRLLDNARGWLDLPESEQLRAMARAEQCTAMGGPRGRYKVADGKLWLHGLYRCAGDMALSAVYPGTSQPMFANWVTGTLTAEFGPIVCRSKNGLPVFEEVVTFTVDAGKITDLTHVHAEDRQCGDKVHQHAEP